MILDKLVLSTKARYDSIMKKTPIEELIQRVEKRDTIPFYDLVNRKSFILISECKKASPSKGIIEKNYQPDSQSKKYILGGTDCISCLTEPEYFLGSNLDLRVVVQNAKDKALVLRKDFIISEYQIYESSLLGANIILLIMAILTDEELISYLNLAHSLGLGCLVECHDEEEINRAISLGARVIGVNNRNLKDFTVDTTLAMRMRKKYPNITLISESGVNSVMDVKKIKENGLNGVLMGECLMRSEDPIEFIKECILC